ncbi:MAG TPA: bifunctional DNA-formamidopyrimidine glycosylase/DNA-(apurinic or apyrimidinic site) lyase [Vicinamibacterales bacterium]|nr:bifunctional DNA-formamidopyrimidine glycosylase/DNA-(apurinic or apyrimidinic site) lyase [Vicinamibacterales bacterium]
MPELPEVETIRRRLAPVMRGARIDRVQLRRAGLRKPFPADFVRRLEGRRVRAVDRRGKYLLVVLESGDTLMMHLGMSGSFRIDPHTRRRAAARLAPPDRHDHVVFSMSNGAVVTFNDPRRFGLMDVIGDGALVAHDTFEAMGPEPLASAFDAAALAAACAGKRVALKIALLDQRVVAGIGNIYASEALHRAHLSPRRRASTMAAAAGKPRPHAVRLVAAIKQVLQHAIDRKAGYGDGNRFRVYEREGEPCPTRGCPGRIRRIAQAGRSTFYCPICQR